MAVIMAAIYFCPKVVNYHCVTIVEPFVACHRQIFPTIPVVYNCIKIFLVRVLSRETRTETDRKKFQGRIGRFSRVYANVQGSAGSGPYGLYAKTPNLTASGGVLFKGCYCLAELCLATIRCFY